MKSSKSLVKFKTSKDIPMLIVMLIAILIMITGLSSCGVQQKIPVITEQDGNKQINWYSHKPEVLKKVIAKDKDNYGYFLVALEDGTTYYASFGEYALIEVDDLIEFKSKKMYKIIQIYKTK